MINIDFIRQVGVLNWMSRYSRIQFNKRILKKATTMTLPTGSRLTLPLGHPGSSIFVTNANIDWGSEQLFAAFASNDRDFIDVGANIGYYSNYLSPVVRHVYAFEPDRRNLPAMRINASYCPNVVIDERAVSSRDGTAILVLTESTTTNTLEFKSGVDTMEVPVTTIDSFVSQRPGIDVGLIKTDIEGHDLQALIGMEKTVRQFQPLILSEIIIDAGLIDLVRKWDYRIFAFVCSRKNFSFAFREFPLVPNPSDWYNMVFLVPRHLDIDRQCTTIARFDKLKL
jgi:FkbM family methyltransferase